MRHRIVVACILGLGFSVSAQAATLERVAVGIHSGFTRIVFHLDAAASYAVNRQANGAPIILLEGVEAAGAPVVEPGLSGAEAPLTGITFRVLPTGLEALLAVAGPVRAKSFALKPDSYGGYRVVIDVRRSDSSTVQEAPPPAPAPAPAMVPAAASTAQSAPVEAVTVASINPPPDAMSGPKVPLIPSVGAAYPDPIVDDSPVCSTYTKALDENQWDMDALITYGACLSNSGDLTEAAATFERILSFDPDFHRARLNLAAIYARQGKTAKAEAAYKYVLLSAPPTDVVRVIQAALHDLSTAKDSGATAQK